MTSFQINLLRDDERSSDSSLSRRSLLRIALPVFPFILLVVIGSLFLSSRKKSNAYNEILLANQSLKSRIERYTKPAAHSRKHRELADELTEWRDLQPAVANWLQELRTNIPPTIQIQGLSVGLALVQVRGDGPLFWFQLAADDCDVFLFRVFPIVLQSLFDIFTFCKYQHARCPLVKPVNGECPIS